MSIFLPELDALFLHVPKTGGMWVKKVLAKSGLKIEEALGPGSHNLPRAYRSCANRFCFVRRPMEWYWSIWRGLQSGWPDKREIAALHRERSWSPIRMLTYLAGERTFPEFCDTLLKDQPGFVSRMFEWYIGPPGAPQVTAVGQQEHLQEHLLAIVSQFGFKGTLAEVEPENEGPIVWQGSYDNLALRASEAVAYDRWYSSGGPFFITQ